MCGRKLLQITAEISVPFFSNNVESSHSLLTALKDNLISEAGILCSLKKKEEQKLALFFR